MRNKLEDYITIDTNPVPTGAISIDPEQYDQIVKNMKTVYSSAAAEYQAKEAKPVDVCPSCGAKHFEVLYSTSTCLAGSGLIYNKDHWEYHDPNYTCMRVKCLDCGAIYDI